jgi:hypothetical protein
VEPILIHLIPAIFMHVQNRRIYTWVSQRQKAYRPQISSMKFVERPKFLILLYRTWNTTERAPITRTCILSLKFFSITRLERPAIFMSRNGELILEWGRDRKSLDHRFQIWNFVERPKFLILLYRTWNTTERAPITRTCTLINVN